MRIVTDLIEYLGEFEFMFETVLDDESDGLFWSKKTAIENLMLGHVQSATGSDQPFRRQSRSNHLTGNTIAPSGPSYEGGAHLVSTFKNIFPGTGSSVGEIT